MPELPEVETIRLSLTSKIVGKIIAKIDIFTKKQFIGEPQKIIGRQITNIIRRGKILTFILDQDWFLNIHLKLTGQLLYAANVNQAVFNHKIPFVKTQKMPSSTTRVIMIFTDQSGLFFNDLRKFGWLKVSRQPEKVKAPDVLSPDFNLPYFAKTVRISKKPIKVLLMDQEKIAGLGNIYANDALFLAKIHPLKKAYSLRQKEVKTLYQKIIQVIKEALKWKGSSDVAYLLPDATTGRYQNHFKVYGREKEPCLVCATPIKRLKHHGRSSFFCPDCQKGKSL